MRTILIPTDFTVDSLIPLKKILQINGDDPIRVVLFHCISLSDSITDLLFFSKAAEIRRLGNPAFTDACEIIRNRFIPQPNALLVDLFTGNNAAAFENFVEGHRADTLCLIENFVYRRPSRQSVDPREFIRKSPVPVLKVNVELPTSPLTQNCLAALFSETI